MIVEDYTAEAYCDMPGHPYGRLGCYSSPAVFVGHNKRETDRKRKLAGWTKRHIDGEMKDCCPICKVNDVCTEDVHDDGVRVEGHHVGQPQNLS